ncbi:MAG: lipopolysaccharide transport periplasmic protein LptA [Gammaproteobacteria bacterium]|nr:lipopolysaccharide transport periplasmic protein LptA [Gammaproteobacteria bacterium]
MKTDSTSLACRNWWLSLILVLGYPLLCNALESDSQQPLFIEADGADISETTGVSIYTGNVVISQGSIRLSADKVTVTQQGEESDHILAEGTPVRFQQQTEESKELVKGEAKSANYHLNSEIIHMIGNAVLIQGKDTFRSDRITYDRVKGQVRAGKKAKGNQRVHIAIQPQKKK